MSAAAERGGIKISITALNQAVGKTSVVAVSKCAEVIYGGHARSGADLVNRTSTVEAAAARGSIDAGVCGLQQSRAGVAAISAGIVIAEAIQGGDCARWRHLEGGAVGQLLRATVGGAGVEVSVDALGQGVFGSRAVGTVEVLDYCEGLCGSGCGQ